MILMRCALPTITAVCIFAATLPAQPPEPTRTPLVRTVDLNVGEQQEVVLCDGSKATVSASLGFVQIPLGISGALPGSQWQRFIDIADQLLYLAKERGRGQAYGLVWKSGSTGIAGEDEVVEALSKNPFRPPPELELLHLMSGDSEPGETSPDS